MKHFIILLFSLLLLNSITKAQSLYCGGICINNISIGTDSVGIVTSSYIVIGPQDTVFSVLPVYYRWLRIAMYGINIHDTLGFPTLAVIDTLTHDTIGNKDFLPFSFYQYTDSVTIDSVPTKLYSLPASFVGYVLLIDNSTHDTCRYIYPMNCATTSIHEQQTETNSIRIFPNPASSIININIENLDHQAATINIYNDFGQLVKSFVTTNTTSSFSGEGLTDGIYFVTVDLGNVRLKSKLVIQK